MKWNKTSVIVPVTGERVLVAHGETVQIGYFHGLTWTARPDPSSSAYLEPRYWARIVDPPDDSFAQRQELHHLIEITRTKRDAAQKRIDQLYHQLEKL